MRLPDFNCAIVTKVHTMLDIAIVGEQKLTSTRSITVPYIANIKDVAEGEDLIMRRDPRADQMTDTQKKRKRRRNVEKDEEAEAQKKAKQQKT